LKEINQSCYPGFHKRKERDLHSSSLQPKNQKEKEREALKREKTKNPLLSWASLSPPRHLSVSYKGGEWVQVEEALGCLKEHESFVHVICEEHKNYGSIDLD
jgi:putative NADH-flavin reductase